MKFTSVVFSVLLLLCDGAVSRMNPTDFEIDFDEECGTLYLLFMVNFTIYHHDLWTHYLDHSQQQNSTKCPLRYEIFVHSQNATRDSHPSLRHKIVPTVPTIYCNDLVSPMIQLLAYATNPKLTDYPPSKNDAFIFLSADTIPIKPLEMLTRNIM